VIAQISPLAGKTIEPSTLVNVPRLVTAYFTGKLDATVPSQRVAFIGIDTHALSEPALA
jgi:phosphoglucomutase